MKTHHWAHIYEVPESDPVKDRMVIDRRGYRSVMVPVADVAEAAEVAIELVAQGVEFIELCSAFGSSGLERIVEAIEGKVAVGVVTYSGESAVKRAAVFLDDEKAVQDPGARS